MSVKTNPYQLLLLAVVSGFLFWLGWPSKPMPFFLFAAFVPLLAIEKMIIKGYEKRTGRRFLLYTYIAFLIWNVSTTWWVYNATPPGGIFAMTVNALLMCIPMMFFFFTKKFAGSTIGYLSLAPYFIAFEYLHMNWDLSWPWLTLGNAFASLPSIVQWYEFTGVLGGSLWVIAVNIFIFLNLEYFYGNKKKHRRLLPFVIALILMPLLYSLAVYFTYEEKGTEKEIVIVQPNIDPYNEKFFGSENFIPYEKQFERLVMLSEKEVSEQTDYLVWPETALPGDLYEPRIHEEEIVRQLAGYAQKYPRLSIVTGIDSYTIYGEDSLTPTARYSDHIGFYDVFNTAMQINYEGDVMLYHKSRLVPGVEQLPYPHIFGVLTRDLGGFVGTLGKQADRTVFFNRVGTGVAPVICYESIFGDFVNDYIINGAELIFIITNDGWWGNTQGHKQHLQYAALRAVETRKSIARSANTGISAFINQRGDIMEATDYGVQDVRKAKIRANDFKTFYTIYGDYTGVFSCYISAMLIPLVLYFRLKNKKKMSDA